MSRRNRNNKLASTARAHGSATAGTVVNAVPFMDGTEGVYQPAPSVLPANTPWVAPTAAAHGHEAAGSMNEQAFEEGRPVSEDELMAHTVTIPDVAMFRSGDYGPKGKYTDEDLQELAGSYDPDWLEAPVTVDHVQTGPALGWVENIRTSDGILYGDFRVSRDTYEAMKAGAYKRRSIEIYRGVPYKDGSKVQYVKACSILGAATPEVKGLPQVRFSDNAPAPHECFEFSDNPVPRGEGEPMMKESTMPEEVINTAPAGQNVTPVPTGVGNISAEQFSAISRETEQLRRELEEAREREARFTAGLSEVNERLRQSDEAHRFNESAGRASQEGRITVNERDVLAAVFNALPYDAADGSDRVSVSFADAEGNPALEQLSPRQLLLRYMETKTKIVPINEPLATIGQAAFAAATTPAAGGKAMSGVERSRWIDKRAAELNSADPNRSFGDCMLAAERELTGR